MSLDQLYWLRPMNNVANYKTPIKGLYMCGSSTHPGMSNGFYDTLPILLLGRSKSSQNFIMILDSKIIFLKMNHIGVILYGNRLCAFPKRENVSLALFQGRK
jgi:hypothetical protein